jgi:hypothetical protein
LGPYWLFGHSLINCVPVGIIRNLPEFKGQMAPRLEPPCVRGDPASKHRSDPPRDLDGKGGLRLLS